MRIQNPQRSYLVLAQLISQQLPATVSRIIPPDGSTDVTVWHYTSMPTLLNMLGVANGISILPNHFATSSVQSFWASSAKYMNDSQEFEYGKQKLLDSIVRLRNSGNSNRIVCRSMERAIRRADPSGTFCVCFSRALDDLAQWRGYGDSGKGVCVGFDRSGLVSRANGICRFVVYKSAEQHALADAIAQSLYSFVYPLMSTHTSGVREQLRFMKIIETGISQAVPALFMLFKHPAFEAEGEFRIIHTIGFGRGGTLTTCFRSDGHRLIPFVKIDLGGGPPPLTHIYLGPGAANLHNAKGLELLCTRLAIPAITLKQSEIPFVP
jgi:Protein of unknown function (DUF2971)